MDVSFRGQPFLKSRQRQQDAERQVERTFHALGIDLMKQRALSVLLYVRKWNYKVRNQGRYDIPGREHPGSSRSVKIARGELTHEIRRCVSEKHALP